MTNNKNISVEPLFTKEEIGDLTAVTFIRPGRSDLKHYTECEFKDSTFYYVWVSCRHGNPPFKAILYTGFGSGSYRTLFTGSECVGIDDRVKFEIIREVGRSHWL